MSDNVTVELGGKSKYEIAYTMARELFQIRGTQITEAEYLKTMEDCMTVLNGGSAPDR